MMSSIKTTGSKQVSLKIHSIALLGSLSAVISFYSHFSIQNRLRQIQLAHWNSLLIGMTLGLLMYFVFKAETFLEPTRQGNYLFGFYLPLASLLCNFANRRLFGDEKLIGMDRILIKFKKSC